MIPVVFEDKFLLVINKPAGITVNKAETTRGQITVEDWLPATNLERRGIVHRLDKDTSGLLIIAKTQPVFKGLQRQFKQRLVEKTYWTLVHGRVEPKSGQINLPVARNPMNRQRFGVFITGRPAISRYQVMKNYKDYSLVTVWPKTGRTHQIRVHFLHLGHPLVADPLYLGEKRLKQDHLWCPRLFLHCRKIRFTHPVNQEIIDLEAPLAHDLETALHQIPA